MIVRKPNAARSLGSLSLAALALMAFGTLDSVQTRAADIQPIALVPQPGSALTEALPAPSQPVTLAPSVAIPETHRELGEGLASYYGRSFAGRRTASGESFDPGELTAAHPTLPFGSKVRVTDIGSGRSVVVRINDRGPYGHRRLIDVSEAAARQLGLIARGSGKVRLALMSDADADPAPGVR